MLFNKCAARRRFQIPLKLCCLRSIRKRSVSFQTPRPPLLRVKHSPRVVGVQPHRQIIGQPCVEPSRFHFRSGGRIRKRILPWLGLAESKLAALTLQGKTCPPSLKLRRDSLRSSLRRERRLEVRGSNPWPSHCERDALPAELYPRNL